MGRRVVALAVALLLAGCAPAPAAPPTGTPSGVPLTPQILGGLIEEHFGAAFALTGEGSGRLAIQPTEWIDGIVATAHYRATPAVPARQVTVTFAPAPHASVPCGPPTCVERGAASVRTPRLGTPDVLSARPTGLVQVQVSGADLAGAVLDDAVALATDARIAVRTDPALSSAAPDPRWRGADLGCPVGVPARTVPLPERSGALAAPTPQALAAVIASRVPTTCAGGDSAQGTVRATAYLGADSEQVSLAVTDQPPACAQLDACETRDGVLIGWQFDVPEGQTAMVRLARRGADRHSWIVVEHRSLAADAASRRFPVDLETLLVLVHDARVAPRVDAALNRAGDDLPLPWRLAPDTVD